MRQHLHLKSFHSPLAFLIGILFFVSSCELPDRFPEPNPEPQDKVRTYYGPATPLGKGMAKAWVSLNEQGEPVSVGANISERAIKSMGDEHEVYNLRLPKQAESTLYEYVTLDWNPHGHPAEGIYTLPHFDLHFYMLPEEEVAAIPPMAPFDENGAPQFDELPASVYVPQDYIPEPGIVPAMGVHWLDTLAPEHNGEVFTQTFIYGSYNGEFIFHEPMFTLAYLEDLKEQPVPQESFEIKQPEAYQAEGYYPMEYSYTYDPKPGMFTISLDNFELKQ